MHSRIPISVDRRALRIAGIYLASGATTGLAFQYLTRIKALEGVFFQPAGKFSIPTYDYWFVLGLSLLLAISIGWTTVHLSRWQAHRQICWLRYVLVSVLVITSVPFQVWFLDTRLRGSEDYSINTAADLYVFAATGSVAAILYCVGSLARAQWKSRLPVSIVLVALLAWLPIGAFSLFLTLAASTVTGRLQLKFPLLLVLLVLVAFIITALLGQVLCITTSPLAEAATSALFGYELYRHNSRVSRE